MVRSYKDAFGLNQDKKETSVVKENPRKAVEDNRWFD